LYFTVPNDQWYLNDTSVTCTIFIRNKNQINERRAILQVALIAAETLRDEYRIAFFFAVNVIVVETMQC